MNNLPIKKIILNIVTTSSITVGACLLIGLEFYGAIGGALAFVIFGCLMSKPSTFDEDNHYSIKNTIISALVSIFLASIWVALPVIAVLNAVQRKAYPESKISG